MELYRIRHRILWVVMLAVFFGSLAPSLTTFVGNAAGKTWVEVCTSTGTQLMALGNKEAPEPDSLHASGHCPYCRLQQDLPAIAHAPGVLILADGSVRGVPEPPALAPPIFAAIWPAHQSRAPPFSY